MSYITVIFNKMVLDSKACVVHMIKAITYCKVICKVTAKFSLTAINIYAYVCVDKTL